MAMVLVSPDGARRLGHGGYGGGFSAQAAYYPDAEMTVVVVLNRFVFPEYIERRIARRLLGLPEATVREVALSADERQRYVGSYDIGVPGRYPTVVERDGQLWFEARPIPPQPLTHVGAPLRSSWVTSYSQCRRQSSSRSPIRIHTPPLPSNLWLSVRCTGCCSQLWPASSRCGHRAPIP
jgi:hypothetical protein